MVFPFGQAMWFLRTFSFADACFFVANVHASDLREVKLYPYRWTSCESLGILRKSGCAVPRISIMNMGFWVFILIFGGVDFGQMWLGDRLPFWTSSPS